MLLKTSFPAQWARVARDNDNRLPGYDNVQALFEVRVPISWIVVFHKNHGQASRPNNCRVR